MQSAACRCPGGPSHRGIYETDPFFWSTCPSSSPGAWRLPWNPIIKKPPTPGTTRRVVPPLWLVGHGCSARELRTECLHLTVVRRRRPSKRWDGRLVSETPRLNETATRPPTSCLVCHYRRSVRRPWPTLRPTLRSTLWGNGCSLPSQVVCKYGLSVVIKSLTRISGKRAATE